MTEKNDKTSRRDALRRMAKASMGIGMCLQLAGTFAPAAYAVSAPVQGARFGIIGGVSSPANAVLKATAADPAVNPPSDCYQATYANSTHTYSYSRGTCP